MNRHRSYRAQPILLMENNMSMSYTSMAAEATMATSKYNENVRCTKCNERFCEQSALERIPFFEYLMGETLPTCPFCGHERRPLSGGGCGHYVQSQRFKRVKAALRGLGCCPDWIEDTHMHTYVHGWDGAPLPEEEEILF